MRFFWLVFTGMFITILSIFIFNTTWNMSDIIHKNTSPKLNNKAKSQDSMSSKNTQTIHENSLLQKNNHPKHTDVPIPASIQEKTLSDDEQIYKKEISEAYPDEVEIKPLSKPIRETSILSIQNATEVKMKIKAKERDGIVKAKVAISHDMLTYAQAKKKGKTPHFITHITAKIEDRIVYDASTSQFLSKNPLMKFQFKGHKGEILTVLYKQITGEVFYASKKIR